MKKISYISRRSNYMIIKRDNTKEGRDKEEKANDHASLARSIHHRENKGVSVVSMGKTSFTLLVRI